MDKPPSYNLDLISFKSTSKPLSSASKALLYVPQVTTSVKVTEPLQQVCSTAMESVKSAPSISVF